MFSIKPKPTEELGALVDSLKPKMESLLPPKKS
jgi:hypothetical protein